MRLMALAIMVGAALAATNAPAMAAWHGYISHTLGFAFAAPGELKMEKGTYRGAVAGARDTLAGSPDDLAAEIPSGRSVTITFSGAKIHGAPRSNRFSGLSRSKSAKPNRYRQPDAVCRTP